MFADILMAYYKTGTVGHFSAPEVQGSNNFWLMKLVGKDIYRGDEVILEKFTALQKFKQLTENCSHLETDVKYREAVPIEPRPTIVTCNGNCPQEICPHFSSEIPALMNRCVFVMMQKHMYTRLKQGHVSTLIKNGPLCLYLMKQMRDAWASTLPGEEMENGDHYNTINNRFDTIVSVLDI